MALYKVTSKQEVTDYCKEIYSNGYTKGLTSGIKPLDPHYTFRKGELTIMTGFANIGKTTTQLNPISNLGGGSENYHEGPGGLNSGRGTLQ